ncbi:MAG: mevalonate kinase [Nanoarchaeota archaeon]
MATNSNWHSGYGKVILFGEHFLVYGNPGIAAPLSQKIEIMAEMADKKTLKAHRESDWAVKAAIAEHLGISDGFKLHVKGDLPLSMGLGSSAAFCAAAARALNDLFSLKLSDEEINDAAYSGEVVNHERPSGIDNTVATFGTMIFYAKQSGFTNLDPVEIPIVLAGVPRNKLTKDAIMHFRQVKERNPGLFTKHSLAAAAIAYDARQAIENKDLQKLGHLMDMNHALLRDFGVSDERTERAITIAKEAGASGAKITGAGFGGFIIALTPHHQDKVASALSKAGYQVIISTIGGKP